MIIGLTGSLGSGKSSALKVFEEAGFMVMDCDRLVRDLLVNDVEVRNALVAHWGEGILSEEGDVINRMKVAEKVFSDPKEKVWLEGVLHPRVRSIWVPWVAKQRQAGQDCVVEIQLLFEKDLQSYFDITVCVSAKPESLMTRAEAKGYTVAQAQARIKQQLPLEEKERRASYVIRNDGSLGDLRVNILSFIEQVSE